MIPKTYNDLVSEVKEITIDDSIAKYWEFKEALKKNPTSEILRKKLAYTKAIIEVICKHFEYWEKLFVFSTLDNTLEVTTSSITDLQQEVGNANNRLTFELVNETNQFLKNNFNFN